MSSKSKPGADAALQTLRDEYRSVRDFRSDERRRLKRKYEAMMEVELEESIRTAEAKFARRLFESKGAYGLRVTDLQDHVLRTRSWNRWEYWRDLAGIRGEVETAQMLREEAERYWRWNGDVIEVFRSKDGEELDPVIRLTGPWRATRYNPNALVPADVLAGDMDAREVADYVLATRGDWNDLFAELGTVVRERGEVVRNDE